MSPRCATITRSCYGRCAAALLIPSLAIVIVEEEEIKAIS